MPRKIYSTPKFNGGMILNADPSDLPEGFGVVALNTMPSLDTGVIGGRFDDGDYGDYEDVEDYTYITKDGTTPTVNGTPYDFVYIAGNGFTLMANGTSVPTRLVKKCVTGHRNYALAGLGKDYPAHYFGYSNGSATLVSTPNVFDTSKFVVVGQSVDPTVGVSHAPFEAGATYYYAFSIVLDGYMHSPLVEFFSRPTTTKMGSASYTMQQIDVVVRHTLDAEAAKRVTSVNVYRSVSSAGLTKNERSEFLKVHEFTGADLALMVGVNGQNYNLAKWSDGNTVLTGQSFENASGLNETLEFCTLGYSIAYEMNNFLFVGDVGWKPTESDTQQIPEGARLLYRSLRGKFCQFRIIDDYIALPFVPVAITSFNNRLVVFGSAEFAIVNPETMVIENVVNGYGIESRLCIYPTLQGLFFANKNNMYVYDGQQVTPIGTPLLKCTDAVSSSLTDIGILTYEEVASLNGSFVGIQRVTYAPRINSMLFLFSIGFGAQIVHAYVFSLDTKTWSVFTFNGDHPKSAYTDRSNTLHISGRAVLTSDNRVGLWKYITRRFDLGYASQVKKVYKVYPATGMRDDDIKMSINGSGFVHDIQFEGSKRAKNVMLKFEPSEEGNDLRGIEIIYREMLNVK